MEHQNLDYMSTTALQMKIKELMRENEKLREENIKKDKALEDVTKFLDYHGYDTHDIEVFNSEEFNIDEDIENETEYEITNSWDESYSAKRQTINGVETKPTFKEEMEEFKKEIKGFDWFDLMPVYCVIGMGILLIIAWLTGNPL